MNTVAVCLSGHSRTFDRTVKKMKEKFGNVDFFFSTWNGPQNEELLKIFSENEINLVSYEFVSEPSQLERERKIVNKFQNSYPDFFILNQWYGVKRAIRLMLDSQEISGKKYDWVFRCRFDLDIGFSIDDLPAKTNADGINIVPASTGGSDQFIYGGFDAMSKFIFFEQWLMQYVERYNGEYGFYASSLVRSYFLDLEIPINIIDLPLKVLRSHSGSPRKLREERTRRYVEANFPDLASILWAGERTVAKNSNPCPWEPGFHPGKNLFFRDGKLV